MGAENFNTRSRGETAKKAFDLAVETALYDYGHTGYTGTIAEKHKFVMITDEILSPDDGEELAEKLMEEDDDRISDKWGPAGCIQIGPDEFIFFGWASS